MHRLPLIVIKRSSRPGKDVAIFHSGYFSATLDWVNRLLKKPAIFSLCNLKCIFSNRDLYATKMFTSGRRTLYMQFVLFKVFDDPCKRLRFIASLAVKVPSVKILRTGISKIQKQSITCIHHHLKVHF